MEHPIPRERATKCRAQESSFCLPETACGSSGKLEEPAFVLDPQSFPLAPMKDGEAPQSQPLRSKAASQYQLLLLLFPTGSGAALWASLP